MKKTIVILIVAVLIFSLPAAAEVLEKSWDEILNEADGKTVNFYMFGGDRRINNWVDTFVADNLKEEYNIHVHRVPMGPDDYLNKLLGEKQIGRETGSIDLLWINGENFKIAKENELLFGPFAEKLPNFNKYIDKDSKSVTHDFGYPTEGYEAPYGKAQFTFIYDSAKTAEAPADFEALTAWIKNNPGKFTYAALPDFTSSAFVRHVIYNTCGDYEQFYNMDEAEFKSTIQPAVEYLKEIEPYLWREGESYPATQAQLDNLYADGEVWMTMGYHPTKAAGEIEKGNFPESSRSFVIEEGTISNTHFLAIPFNAPQKEAALVAANFLLSFEAQYDKMIPANWGDFTVLDTEKLSEKQKNKFKNIDLGKATLPLEELEAHRVPEIPAKWVPIIEEIWSKEVAR
jgi:putative spermidine/putrescine transport system substrate-binding protein